jgi:Uncharacterized conserved protein
MNMIAVRFYIRDTEMLLAACDEELIGKTFREGKMKLTVSKIFYCSEIVDENELKGMMLRATSMNLVGPKTIAVAKDLGLVQETITIEGVEHAQVVRM